MATKRHDWPRWLVGPNGERRVFASPDQVPSGWHDRDEEPAEAGSADEATSSAPPKRKGRRR